MTHWIAAPETARSFAMAGSAMLTTDSSIKAMDDAKIVPTSTQTLSWAAQSPARTIALDGEPQLATHGETDARGFGRFSPEHDERRTVDPLAPLEERLEFGAGDQSLASREATAQTVSRLRPFARRRFNTLRPPFVFMRSRNP